MDILLSVIGSAILAALLFAAYTAGVCAGKPARPTWKRTTNRKSTWIIRMEVRTRDNTPVPAVKPSASPQNY